MASSGKNSSARLIVFLGGMLAVVSLSLTVPSAGAAPLAELTGAVGQVGGAVGEVTQTVAPPLEEITEAATAPVQQAVEPVATPAVEAASAATQPVHEAAEAVTAPVHEAVTHPVHEAATAAAAPVREVTAPAREAAATAIRPVTEAAGGASHQVGRTAAPLTSGATAATAPSAASSAPIHAPVRATPSATGESDGTGTDAGSPAAGTIGVPQTVSAPAGPSGNTFEAPSTGGAVQAPQPPWMAYVWPAVALTGRDVAGFLDRWAEHGLRPALAAYESGAGAGAGASTDAGQGPVVAGVHASGGERSSGSSSSPFGGIPGAVGSVSSHVPGEALAYLLLAALLVVGAFAAYRIESSRHRGQGSG